jgi:5,6-dimethylbenzimidazole synthase
VIVESIKTREKIHKEFKKQNKKANRIFKDSTLYSSLKLEGILESYINIAVFYIKPKKAVLGQTAQKRVGEYSVVCAIQNLWLTARAYGVGVGWVSILKPKKVKKILKVGSDRKLIGYLTVGYVTDFADKPELLTLGWERKKGIDEVVRR